MNNIHRHSEIVIYAAKAAALVLAGIMLMSGCGQTEDVKAENMANADGTESYATGETPESGIQSAIRDESVRTEKLDEPDIIEPDKIDYPFPDSIENWQLVLYTERTAEDKNSFVFKLYDEDRNLVQEFPCEIEAKKLTFRFDRNLCDSWPGLAVFPADAEESDPYGLLYTFDYDTDRFDEEPIEIPWYEEVISSHTILVTDRQENAETKTIFTIDKDLRELIELRIWILSWNRDDGGTAELYIWDCIEQAEIYNGVLYDGEVQWKALGKLADDEYFQDLFFKDLKYPWTPLSDGTIPTVKYTVNSEKDWHIENMGYESKEDLLKDCGFQDAEPFYQYYDRYGNIEMELYFDERAGKGCGFQYVHGFNDELEKVFCCNGFIFEGTGEDEWEDDAFSLLAWGGDRDAEAYEDVTQVNYRYTDDGKISSYEVRGLTENTEAQWWEGMEVKDDFFISIDWVYRSDGTLCRKYYYHNSRVFGTAGQSQWTYYDELGRPIYRDEYITHGSHVYYYIYDGDGMKPKYCLLLDEDGGYSIPSMIVYS